MVTVYSKQNFKTNNIVQYYIPTNEDIILWTSHHSHSTIANNHVYSIPCSLGINNGNAAAWFTRANNHALHQIAKYKKAVTMQQNHTKVICN